MRCGHTVCSTCANQLGGSVNGCLRASCQQAGHSAATDIAYNNGKATLSIAGCAGALETSAVTEISSSTVDSTVPAPVATTAEAALPSNEDLVQVAFSQLHSSDATEQAHALEQLDDLISSSTPDQAAVAAVSQRLDYLANLLQSSSTPDVQAHAAALLRSLACAAPETKEAIAALPGCFGCLIALMGSKDADVYVAPADAVRILVHCADCEHNTPVAELQRQRQFAALPGGLKALAQVLRSGCAAAQEHAAGALQSLAYSGDAAMSANIARVPGCLSALLLLLRSPSVSVQEAAAGALLNLAWKGESGLKIARVPGCLEGLVGLFDSPEVGVQLAAVGALLNLARGSDKMIMARVPGCLEGLTALLSSDCLNLQLEAVWALCSLASAAGNKVSIARCSGCLGALVSLLSSACAGVQEKAARTLWLLAVEGAGTKAAIAAVPGCLDRLVSLFSSRDVDVQRAAVGALQNLACKGVPELSYVAIGKVPGCLEGLVALSGSPSRCAEDNYNAAAGANW